jgi:fructokinase
MALSDGDVSSGSDIRKSMISTPDMASQKSPEKLSFKNANRALIVGEVLFDCFPDHRILGGAPMNVAWNLRGLGVDPLLVTAIGDDEPGRVVIGAMDRWSLDRSALQIKAGHATGRVDIELRSGEPSYRFWDDVAFDHISMPDSDTLSDPPGLIYHGSLAMRGAESRRTILTMRRSLDCPVFVDINIRQPHFDVAWIDWLVRDADHLKLNVDELRLLVAVLNHGVGSAGQPGIGDRVGHDANRLTDWESLRTDAMRLRQAWGIQNVWITAGVDGAAWVGPGGDFHRAEAPPVEKMIDTVGAGDAIAAMTIQGILTDLSPAESLAKSAALASRICGLRGATTEDRSFYSS